MAPVDRQDLEEPRPGRPEPAGSAVRENVPQYDPWADVDASDDKYADNYIGHQPYVADQRDREVVNIQGHVDAYRYEYEENPSGVMTEHVLVDGHSYELVQVSQDQMKPADGRKVWYSGHLHDRKTKFNKVLRGHGKY